MAESRDENIVYWIEPEERGVLPLDAFRISRSLRKTVRKKSFEIRFNSAFPDVIRECARAAPGREDTWINGEIVRAYTELHKMGFVHSVESWRDGKLAGGLYGLALGGAFFGESMFSRVTDASKVALVHLVARLRYGGYVLLDTQFVTSHLSQFGAREIPVRDYLELLDQALQVRGVLYPHLPKGEVEASLLSLFSQSTTQTS